ncbi:MAG: hypothetical protein KIT54_02020 [Phycisphaeraceae bacterium]|nr:hypothetical protein [Phycisphaeraceae bacterium]
MDTTLDREALDLRRKRRRAMVTRILDAADHLPEQERQLILAIYGRGLSVRQAAHLQGLQERRLRRQVKAIVRRICDPAFDAAVCMTPNLPRPLREVVRLVVIQGLSMDHVADHLGMSYHSVRKHAAAFRAIVEASPRRVQPQESPA